MTMPGTRSVMDEVRARYVVGGMVGSRDATK